MARRSRAKTSRTRVQIVKVPKVVKVPAVSRKRGGRRRSRSGGSGKNALKNDLMRMAVGGFAYGFIDKQFPNLPRLPYIGKSGTIAIAAYFLGDKHPIVQDVGRAAAVIAGYTLGKDGAISGYM